MTAIAAWWWLHVPLGHRERRALWALGLGLVLLAAAAQPESSRPMANLGQWALLLAVIPVGALALTASRWRPDAAAAGLAGAAGLGFGGIGIAARALTVPADRWQLVMSPLAWSLVAFGLVATYCYAAALQRGSATVVAAVAFSVETVVPAAVGLAVLGDSARPGFGPVAGAGFVVTVGAAIALARTVQEG